MAKVDPGLVQERLFSDFLAPVVVGGKVSPGRPIGGKTALLFEAERPLADPELFSHVALARVRIARKIAPVDRYLALTHAEWVLSAVLHDVVQSTHPGFDQAFRRSLPNRLLDMAGLTLDRVPDVASVGDALSRHSLFSRLFAITRRDLKLSWWTGSALFRGEDPPARLKAWPEFRKVHEDVTPRPLMDLPAGGSAVDAYRFMAIVERFLQKTPLTNLATITRSEPAFRFDDGLLGLLATRGGRTLALRILRGMPKDAVDVVLGRATGALFQARAFRAALVAIELLAERSLAEAESRLLASQDGEPEPIRLLPKDEPSAAFARAVGAMAARRFIAQGGGAAFSANERRKLLAVLLPAAETDEAKRVEALLQ